MRIMHEKQMNEIDKCHFITLTYRDENLPALRSVRVRDWQLFAKRWRKKYGKFRFFHCGEYGDENQRPHYHACVFGMELEDLVFTGKTKSGSNGYNSQKLTETWGLGLTQVGELTFESAAYVARYIMKKVGGTKKTEGHYQLLDKQTGEILGERKPEYVTMSRKPGIGKTWIDKYRKDVYPRDEVVVNYKKMRPPKYYDTQHEITDQKEMQLIKNKRRRYGKRLEKDNTPERRRTKESILQRKEKRFTREPT